MRRRHLSLAWASSIVLALVSPGCEGAGAFAQMKQSQAAMADNQAEILRQLDALATKVDGIEVAAPSNAAAKRKRPPGPDPAATYKAAIADEPSVGPNTARVTIVEWSDFQCPYCSKAAQAVRQLEEHYGDDLRVVFKHNPLTSIHPRARPAAIAAEAAHRQGKFWEMHDKLFANAKALTDENFVTWAGELGLDVERFKRDLADPALGARITAQQKQGATLGAQGTPSFFINGRYVRGLPNTKALHQLIDAEMKEADALLAKGVAPAKIYDAVIAEGKTRV